MLQWRTMNRSDIRGVAELLGNPALSRLTSLHGMTPKVIAQHAERLLDRNVWCETAWASGKCLGMISLRDIPDGGAWLSVVIDSQRLGLWPALNEATRAVLSMQEAADTHAELLCRTHMHNAAANRVLYRCGWKADHVSDPWVAWEWKPTYAPRIKSGVGNE